MHVLLSCNILCANDKITRNYAVDGGAKHDPARSVEQSSVSVQYCEKKPFSRVVYKLYFQNIYNN